jgi:hypothetical protein
MGLSSDPGNRGMKSHGVNELSYHHGELTGEYLWNRKRLANESSIALMICIMVRDDPKRLK